MEPQPAPVATNEPAAPKRGFFARPVVWIAAAVLVIVVAAGAVAAFVVAPNACNLFSSSRHGLACDVSLPPGATYDHMGTPDKPGTQIWVFVVSNTQSEQMDTFYKAQLPQQGWTNYNAVHFAVTGNDVEIISAHKGGRTVLILADANPDYVQISPGDIALTISLSS